MMAAELFGNDKQNHDRSYQVAVSEENGYLRVEIRGHRSYGQQVEMAKETLALIAEACFRSGLNRVLGVGNLTGQLSAISAFNIAKDPTSFGWDRSIRFAYVDQSEYSKDEIALAETVAVNRGYRQVRIFDNERAALDWLLSEK